MSISKRLLYVLPVLILLAVPAITYAQFFSGIASNALAMVLFGVSFVIASIFGLIITVETWIFQIVLALNTQVVNSDPVKFGFPVALGFTNLLFVVAILVIALATIIRWDSYAVKQTLWKLVLIALLVNFGLVIANAILSFSDSLTLYFVQSVDPGGAALNSDDGFASFMRFGGALAGAFSPQRLWLTDPNLAATMDVKANEADWKTRMGAGGSTIGAVLQPIFGVFFTLIGSMMIAVTLAGLIIMFLHRYVTLAYLMIILPLAWAAFIFPKTEKHWHAWWDRFWKQLLFGPVAIFMLWLGIQVSYVMFTNSSSFGSYAVFTSTSNPVWGSISSLVGSAMGGIIQGFLNMILMISIIGGGLGMAKAMGGAGADVAHNMVMKPVQDLQGRMKNRAKSRAQEIGRGAVSPAIDRLQAKGGFRGRVAGALRGVIGTPRPFKAQDEAIAKIKKDLADSGIPLDDVVNAFNKRRASMSGEERMAYLEHLQKEKALWRVQDTRSLDTEEARKEFEKYRRTILRNQIFDDTGYSVIRTAHSNNPLDLPTLTRQKEGQKRIAGLVSQLEKAREDKANAEAILAAGAYPNGQPLSAEDRDKFEKQSRAFSDKLSSMGTTEAEWSSEIMPKLVLSTAENMAPGQVNGFVDSLSEWGGSKAINAWAAKAAHPSVGNATRSNLALHKYVTTNQVAVSQGHYDLFGVQPQPREGDSGARPTATATAASAAPGGPGRTPPAAGVGAPPPTI